LHVPQRHPRKPRHLEHHPQGHGFGEKRSVIIDVFGSDFTLLGHLLPQSPL
jgi:hypothetical protein